MTGTENKRVRIALFIGAILLFSPIKSQQFLELLPGSQELTFDAKEKCHKILGGASFIYQGNTMYANEVRIYDQDHLLKAYGNVHINKSDEFNLYCDSLIYDTKTSLATMHGNVRVLDQEYKITSRKMEFDTKKWVAIYRTGGKIEHFSNGEILTSKIGYIYPRTNNFFFKDQVNYAGNGIEMTTDTLRYQHAKSTCYFYGPTKIKTEDANLYCSSGEYNTTTQIGSFYKNSRVERANEIIQADTLYYNPTTGQSKAFSNVSYTDTSEQFMLTGNQAIIDDSLKTKWLTGNTCYLNYKNNDSTWIFSDSLFSKNDSLDKPALTKAFHNIRIFNADFQAVADSLVQDQSTEQINLFKNPIVWSDKGELKADTITAFLRDSTLKKLYLRNNAMAIIELDSGQHYNQIFSREMFAYFSNNDLKKIDGIGSSETIFFPSEETTEDSVKQIKRLGMNHLIGSELSVYLDSNEVTGVTYRGKPEGHFFPMEKIDPNKRKVPGFILFPELRPIRPRNLTQE